MNALVVQVGISGPMVLALIVYTAARRGEGRVHRYLFWLLVMILVWMVGMAVELAEGPHSKLLAQVLQYPPACFMSPAFCVMMLLYARVEVFEQQRGARWALLAPFWFFLLAFATDGWHGQMAHGMPITASSQPVRPGPLFYAFQVCSNAVALVGLGVTVRILRNSPLPGERRRMALLCCGAFLPLVVHGLFTFQLVPLAYPLTPASMGVTSLLIVAAILRYRLLDVQPIARRDVIDASGDAVIVADDQGHVVDLNPTARVLLGDPHGGSLADVLAALGRVEPEGAVPRMLEGARSGATPPICELELADGRILEMAVGTPRGESGDAAGCFVVLRDRTKERRAERLLQRSQRLESVGQLAAGVAHEVNNPLAFVRANLAHVSQVAAVLESRSEDLPKEVADETRDLSEVVEDTIAGLDRIQKIVKGLLRLSRTASDRTEVCEPGAIVAEAARFASLDREGRVRLESRLPDDLPRIEVSPDQLVQVLLNLFLNARYALRGRADATIFASASSRGGWVEIRVEDNGPGVPEALRDKVFEPFFTTRDPNEGTGLGLPIAHDIVRDHGGTLELEESGYGGACFVVRLPEAGRIAPAGV